MRHIRINSRITNKKVDGLSRYFSDINKIPTLTPDQEFEVAKRARAGDQKAKDTLVKSNLRFVVSVAKQYEFQNHTLTLQDLINEGNLGLIKAADRFDPARGLKFISYAVWWIRQSILTAIIDMGSTIRLPNNRASISQKLHRVYGELEQALDRPPTHEELSERLKTDPETLSMILNAATVNIEMLVGRDDLPLINMLAADDEMPDLDKDYNRKEIEEAINTLPSLCAAVIRHSYGFAVTKEIRVLARENGYSAEGMRRIKLSGLKKLKTILSP